MMRDSHAGCSTQLGGQGRVRVWCTCTVRLRGSLFAFPSLSVISGQDAFPHEFTPDRASDQRAHRQVLLCTQFRETLDEIWFHGVRFQRPIAFGRWCHGGLYVDIALSCQASFQCLRMACHFVTSPTLLDPTIRWPKRASLGVIVVR